MTIDIDNQTEADATIAQQFSDRLDEVFRRLRQRGIPFCVLRNRDRIPHGLLRGSDVDVIVPAGTSVATLVSVVRELRPAHVVPHRATLEVYFAVGPLLLHVDFLIAHREWRGARYLTNQAILDAAVENDGIPVASPLHQAFCAWFSSLTRRLRFKPRYVPLITAAARDSRNAMAALLEDAFGQRLGRELLELAAHGELERSDEFAKRCRRAIWLRAVRSRPIATLRGLLGHYVSEARLWVRPTGLAIAILGPDGSGKSAVCAALASASRAVLPFSSVSVQHLYERALPRLSELKKGRLRRTPVAPATVHDPHGKRPHNVLLSLVSLTYATVDQWVSRLIFGRAKLAKNMLLVHDRYMSELAVDPRRFRFGGPTWLAKPFARITPPLDLVILLDAPPEVLQRRKQEVPFEETKRQREAYRAVVRQLPHGRIVNADQPVDAVIADVKQVILDCLGDRTARRFGFHRSQTTVSDDTAPVALGLFREGYPQ